MNLFQTLLILLLLSTNLYGQTSKEQKVKHDNQQWFQYYTIYQFKAPWKLLNEAGLRWKNSFSEQSKFYVRTGIGYQLNEEIKLSTSIKFLGGYHQDALNKMEIRPYQEFLFINHYQKARIKHQIRLEERFLRNVEDEKLVGSYRFKLRFRYLFKVSFPMFRNSKTNPNLKTWLKIGNEIFMYSLAEGEDNIFDQNRLLVGTSIQMTPALTLNLIYNSLFGTTQNEGIYEDADIVWIGLKHLIHRKKAKTH